MATAEVMRLRDTSLTVSIVPISSTSSTPVSPGDSPPSSAFTDISSDQPKSSDVEPFVRPKSTPFPEQDGLSISLPTRALATVGSKVSSQTYQEQGTYEIIPTQKSAKVTFDDLPQEIHELILDHIFGAKASVANKSTSSRSWAWSLRHCRRKELSDVARINKIYRRLVQTRIFRHLKIQGTGPAINKTVKFFANHSHLNNLPRHVEVWSPVWQLRRSQITSLRTRSDSIGDEGVSSGPVSDQHSTSVASTYCGASRKSSLYEIFTFVRQSFPEACVLTLEGGDCKKPPQIPHFPATLASFDRSMPKLPTIHTLILKSAWNIIRTVQDFENIKSAFPKLQELHIQYSKAKSKSYLNMSQNFARIPRSISVLSIKLETHYTRESVSPTTWRKIYPEKSHICLDMAKSAVNLESFTYCGRICHGFFNNLKKHIDPDQRGNTKLKSMDITVKNCCRPASVMAEAMDGSGINDPGFVAALETMIIAAIRSLSHFKALTFLRIQFIDLESPMLLLNPFFTLKDNKCSGVWSEDILRALAVSRPLATFSDLSDDFGAISYDKEGKIVPGPGFPKAKPQSIKVSTYTSFSTVTNSIAIN